jgi:sporulation protein YlmC with PRC-barrel domain
VPLDLIDATSGELQIHCSLAEFEKLDPAEETQFLPGSYGGYGYGPGQAYSWPYFGLGGMGMGGGMGTGLGMGYGAGGLGVGNATQTVTYDTVPLGEVSVQRGEHVHATDGEIGKVQGLVIDPSNHHVTHVLLQEGHLWGKKEVAIPIRAITRVDAGIQLTLTKQEVENLPPVVLGDPDK